MASWGETLDGAMSWDFGLTGLFAVIALILTITNTAAFSRCDKFSQASALASGALHQGGIARSIAGGLVSRLWR